MTEDQFREQILKRLDAQADEIRELRRILERLVRLEERQQMQSESIARMHRRMEAFEERLRKMETSSSGQRTSLSWIERIIWGGGLIGAWFGNGFPRGGGG
ncbi:hypothetical protein [Methylohalobius crimeensis]|uniref:hypothetical protein n=1 Tax=Methylohalobius crimeensis TaxID=244365 RepID=UPI00126799F1|nr:hypothetical protein [Methylohalobius crimeensis]